MLVAYLLIDLILQNRVLYWFCLLLSPLGLKFIGTRHLRFLAPFVLLLVISSRILGFFGLLNDFLRVSLDGDSIQVEQHRLIG